MKQTGVGDIAEIMDLKIQMSKIYHFLMVIIFQAQRCLKFQLKKQKKTVLM